MSTNIYFSSDWPTSEIIISGSWTEKVTSLVIDLEIK